MLYGYHIMPIISKHRLICITEYAISYYSDRDYQYSHSLTRFKNCLFLLMTSIPKDSIQTYKIIIDQYKRILNPKPQ
jgi:hypothetical protein